jgi:hypothetical protein
LSVLGRHWLVVEAFHKGLEGQTGSVDVLDFLYGGLELGFELLSFVDAQDAGVEEDGVEEVVLVDALSASVYAIETVNLFGEHEPQGLASCSFLQQTGDQVHAAVHHHPFGQGLIRVVELLEGEVAVEFEELALQHVEEDQAEDLAQEETLEVGVRALFVEVLPV